MTGAAEPDTPALSARLREFANVLAPTTVITALLIYFGFIGTQARFEYFGVDLDLAEMSNRDLILNGLEVVYVPATLLFLALLAATAGHGLMRWLADSSRPLVPQVAAGIVGLVGLIVLGRAVVGILIVEIPRRETPGTTALALALGPALLAYACWIASDHVTRRIRAGAASPRLSAWYTDRAFEGTRRTALVAIVGVVIAGLFWAANSFASAYGAGRGYDDALKLPQRPEIIVDTTEPLVGFPPGITESRLSTDKERRYKFRYSGMRLLLESDGRLFVVPGRWTRQSKTLIIPYGDDVRIQLRPDASTVR